MGIPLFRFLFRKMWNTRWMTLSTLLGLLVAISFTVSIPMYSDGALKRVVSQSIADNSQTLPAGSLLMRYQVSGADKTDLNALHSVDQYIKNDVKEKIGFPSQVFVRTQSLRSTEVYPEDPTKVDASRIRTMTLASMDGLTDKIEWTNGRTYKETAPGSPVEVVMLEDAMYRNDLHIGAVLEYPVSGGAESLVKVKIVGTFKPLKDTDPYWYQGFDSMVNMLYVAPDIFENKLLKEMQIPINQSSWYYAFDLRDIQTSQITDLSRTLNRLKIDLNQQLKDTKVELSFEKLLEEFRSQSIQLQMMLLTLAAPMIAMVFYFIAMNANQSLQKQQSDIAVLRSRGASTRQIIMLYLIEGVILGGVALAIAPFVGWFMAKSIGSANGFLEFVNRKSIPVGFTTDAVIFGIVAVIIALLASIIPAVIFARSSIVNLKQKLARSDKKPFWQRWFLDILLLGVAGYGYYLSSQQQMLSFQTGMSADQLQVQPFLFFVPAIAIFASGLFFLRLFPWILKIIQWIGGKLLPVPLYLTLTQLSRSSTAYYPLMILLILTLGLGVYNSSAARTIDVNSTEQILYKYAADVVITPVFESYQERDPDAKKGNQGGGSGQGGGTGRPPGGGGQDQQPQGKIIYNEPPFEVFKRLPGVEAATRVMQVKANVLSAGSSLGSGNLVGIDNVDFAKVAWFREDMYPLHPNLYLDALGKYMESAVIIPTSVAKQNQINPGDPLTLTVNGQELELVVVGTLPYWPGQYPAKMPFYIVNLDYVYDQLGTIPYDVLVKMKDGAKLKPIMDALQKEQIDLVSIKDANAELRNQSKHPTRGGVFGILSLGFLISIIVSLIGYILYWFFNLSGRVVQFGVLRAMGLSRRQLTGMLLLEQIFTAGLAIGLGVLIGKLASILFLPFLQSTTDARMQVPPFRIIFDSKDTMQLYIVVGVMMLLGASLLFVHIRRLRVHQAVKMGEER
ncbi:ABC transporter permease [Paenibacillus sp. SC116]|uniref:ABC transporter permease n=1 Tax=Paenibacillus sp. SC116 TaxID=2968986 RepID=UPI00215A8909|nr:ABC transporter permease [Paenibacillus sp. SC116]MCR8845704.1 ABC transporter permease [Paenibacillus sp. SC116]